MASTPTASTAKPRPSAQPLDVQDRLMEETPQPKASSNKRPRMDENPSIVRCLSASPERLALRKEPKRQNLWEREAMLNPLPPLPSISAPSEDTSTFTYIPELDLATFLGIPTCRWANPHFRMSRNGERWSTKHTLHRRRPSLIQILTQPQSGRALRPDRRDKHHLAHLSKVIPLGRTVPNLDTVTLRSPLFEND
ncbi:hypothetical protein GY45DRAFT_1376006 [Cubamyces sp. BRFM 1775]|nr:hypothetical protein GY45DRAFT_1376006 [Cubamyces sp. BRFM 1775]